MTTTSERLRTFWGDRRADPGDLVSLAVRYWQPILLIALVTLGAVLRLWGLDWRAIHHDESIHTNFAFDIKERGVEAYEHNPVYHGPFQYFATVVAYILSFEVSDYTGRLPAAVFGIMTIPLPLLLRRQLGTLGAYAGVFLIAISPVILYVSRFARADMYVIFFTLATVVCIWRYLAERPDEDDPPMPETGAELQQQASTFFDYVSQRHNLWLIAIGPLMALSFASKEITGILVGILILYVNLLVGWDLLDQLRARRKLQPIETGAMYVVFALTAWLIVALWPILKQARSKLGFDRMPRAGGLLIVMGTLGATQFGPLIQVLGFGDGGQAGYMQESTLMHIVVLTLIFAGAAVGLMWNWRVWLLAAVLFYAPFVILFTSFFANMEGFWTGIWGSMDYWLSQHDVRRGNQPDYYYFMLTPVYEFLPLLFGLGGTLYYAFRGRLEQKLLSLSALLLIFVLTIIPGDVPVIGSVHMQLAFMVAIGAVLLLSMDVFTKFLIYWVLAVLFALSVAGEKMPWLTVHIALPLALLAAKMIDNMLASFPAAVDEAKDRARSAANGLLSPWLALGAMAALAIGAAILFQTFGFQPYGPGWAGSVFAWLLAVAAFAIVVGLASEVSLEAAGQVVAVGVFAALLVFTVRAAGFAAYDQGDTDGYPQELLIYAQGSPKLGVIADEIYRISDLSGRGFDQPIYIDNSGGRNIWPWPWYLRDYRNVHYTPYEDVTLEPGAIVLIANGSQGKIASELDQFHDPVPYEHMWWFRPEVYAGLNATDFLKDVITGGYTSTWAGYFIDRTVPGVNPTNDMFAYFPREFPSNQATEDPGVEVDDPVPVPAAGVPLPESSLEWIAREGTGDGELNRPADVAVDGDGNVYVVDTLNHRIVVFAQDGSVESFGEEGTEPGQFRDPFSDDYQVHDGPWGIAVDRDGNIYVADTWNGQIQKFDSDFEPVLQWGAGDLFGPRDVALDQDGNLLVVDTGNKRVVKYTTEGVLLDSYDTLDAGVYIAGSEPGQFDEPSAIAVTANGDIYVADYWNQRIQHFDSSFTYIDEISVPSWGSKGITDRAYILALDDGRVIATDPQFGRLAVFDPSGEEENSWRIVDDTTPSRLVGIAMDADERVYVIDALATEDGVVEEGEPAGGLVGIALGALLGSGAGASP